MDGSDWGGLAPEILINIISRLTIQERWTGPMFVRKSWLTVCRDPYLWSTFDLEPWFESYPESIDWWSPEFERKIDSMIRSVVDWSDGGLTEIRVRYCSDHALSYVADRCSNLQVLAIRSSPNVTDASMTKIAFRCRSLKELDISYCHEISHDTLVMIGRNCPNLRTLKRNLMDWSDSSRHIGSVPTEYLDACPQDGDTEADAIGKHMINLEHLEIQFSRLSVKGLASICEGCPKLEYFDLFGCVHLSSRDITNNVSRLKWLKEVKKPDVYVPRSGDVAQMERENKRENKPNTQTKPRKGERAGERRREMVILKKLDESVAEADVMDRGLLLNLALFLRNTPSFLVTVASSSSSPEHKRRN